MRDSKPFDDPDGAPGSSQLATLGLVHDLNQHLSVVLGRTQLLLDLDPDPQARRHLELIMVAAGDAAARVRSLLDAGRSTAAACAAPIATVPLRDIVNTCLELTGDRRRRLESAGDVAYTIRNTIAEEHLVAVPPSQLRDVLNNVLINACEAMPGGGELALSSHRQGPDSLVLTVTDRGAGMDEATVSRVFEVGFSAHKEQGHGIGLAISRQLLAGFGGTIELRSQQNVGTTVVVTLPAATDTGDPRADTPLPATEPGQRTGQTADAAAGRSLRIMVVDDEQPVRDMLQDFLVADGHRPLVGHNAKQALAAFATHSFDVLITDLSLPGRSGLALARRVRTLDDRIAIVLISGWGTESTIAEIDPAIVDLTTHKPVDLVRLRDVLSRVASGRSLRSLRNGGGS